MCIYTRLEVAENGDIRQSGSIVLRNGYLPHPQNGADIPRYATAYTEAISTQLVTAAVTHEDKIIGIYVPRKLRPSQYWRLLGPIAVAAFLCYTVLSVESGIKNFYYYVVLTAILTFLIALPNLIWGIQIYTRSSPTEKTLMLLKEKYLSIPIYRDADIFYAETKNL